MHSWFFVRGQLTHSIATCVKDPKSRVGSSRQGIAQEIRNDRAVRGIWRGVFTIAERAGSPDAAGDRAIRIVLRRRLDRKEISPGAICFGELLERCDVIDDVNPATVCANHEI